MNRRFIRWIGLGLVMVLICQVFIPAIRSLSLVDSAIDPEVESNTLEATVQIWLISPVTDLSGDARFNHRERGLGTLANWQGAPVIVTHNHWGDLLFEAETVEIRDAQGLLLVTLGINEFTSRIWYRDPGTLILNAPSGLPITPAELLEDPVVDGGDIVVVVRQDPENHHRVNLLQARVRARESFSGHPVFQLALPDRARLVPGDSGGGVWFQGKLVGNNWAQVKKVWLLSLTQETGMAAQFPVSFLSQNLNGQPEPVQAEVIPDMACTAR